LKFKICILCWQLMSCVLSKRSSVQWRIAGIATRFVWMIIFFNGGFEYGDGGISNLWGVQKLQQSTWYYEILYALERITSF
jgi:hypothetical protein